MSRFLKNGAIIFALIVALNIQIIPVFACEEGETVYLGGMPAGFVMQMQGVEVVGLSDVVTDSGMKSPAKDCGIKTGDKIVRLGSKTINSASDLDFVWQFSKTMLLRPRKMRFFQNPFCLASRCRVHLHGQFQFQQEDLKGLSYRALHLQRQSYLTIAQRRRQGCEQRLGMLMMSLQNDRTKQLYLQPMLAK